MKYEIWGEICPAVTIKLNKGESVVTQYGGMSWMSDKVEVHSSKQKGFKELNEIYDGFLVQYAASDDKQEITFSATRAGQIAEFDIKQGQPVVAQKALLLCAESTVRIKDFLAANYKWQLKGAGGYDLQQYEGEGKVFMEINGSVRRLELEAGEKLIAETGNLAAWEAGVHTEVSFVRDNSSILFRGQGTLMTTVTGPGRIWLQTAPVSELAKRVTPYIVED